MSSILPQNRPPGKPSAKGHAAYRLTQEILSRSVARTWAEARREWELAYVYFAEVPGTCLCGHHPILENCVIVSRENGNEAVVGNVCVTRFLGIDSEAVFRSLRRVLEDPTRPLNEAAVEHAYGRGWLNDWEREFLLGTSRKRSLSPRQRAKRVQINRKVLGLVRAAARGGAYA
jgi:hypothetical protein